MDVENIRIKSGVRNRFTRKPIQNFGECPWSPRRIINKVVIIVQLAQQFQVCIWSGNFLRSSVPFSFSVTVGTTIDMNGEFA
jgi:hypothetical protein